MIVCFSPWVRAAKLLDESLVLFHRRIDDLSAGLTDLEQIRTRTADTLSQTHQSISDAIASVAEQIRQVQRLFQQTRLDSSDTDADPPVVAVKAVEPCRELESIVACIKDNHC